MRPASILALALAGCTAMVAADRPPLDWHLVESKANIQSAAIKEASGLAPSRRDSSFIWIINDSGSPAEIHLASTDGTDRGKLTLDNTPNTDWEDLASFSLNGNPYLMVADTGDNDARHPTRTLYVVAEPKLPAAGEKLDTHLSPAWQIRFRYEDGPRDCESVAVDVPNRKVLLLSKRTDPPALYELPLTPTKSQVVSVARRIGQTHVTAPVDIPLPFRNQPTALDISRDQSLAAVATYYGVFLFLRAPDESWTTAFARAPLSLPPHQLAQAEALAFSDDGNTILVLSEGRKSPIAIYQRPPASASSAGFP